MFRTHSLKSALLAIALVAVTTARAGTTVINRTANDLFVAVGVERASGPTHDLDSSHPGHMETTGWFKLNRFGGSTTVPYALVPNPYAFGANAGSVTTYIFIEAGGGIKMRNFPTGSRTFPVGRPNTFSFKWDFPDEPKGPRLNGRLAGEARRQGLQLETFAPMASFRSGDTVELTMDNLGWNGAQPVQNNPPAGGSASIQRRVWTYRDGRGSFTAQIGGWLEHSGANTFRFREVARTNTFIELFDERRAYTVRLFDNIAQIKGGNKSEYYFADFTRFADGQWSR